VPEVNEVRQAYRLRLPGVCGGNEPASIRSGFANQSPVWYIAMFGTYARMHSGSNPMSVIAVQCIYAGHLCFPMICVLSAPSHHSGDAGSVAELGYILDSLASRNDCVPKSVLAAATSCNRAHLSVACTLDLVLRAL
jgi:hypothetical protein